MVWPMVGFVVFMLFLLVVCWNFADRKHWAGVFTVLENVSFAETILSRWVALATHCVIGIEFRALLAEMRSRLCAARKLQPISRLIAERTIFGSVAGAGVIEILGADVIRFHVVFLLAV